jgi:lysozyme
LLEHTGWPAEFPKATGALGAAQVATGSGLKTDGNWVPPLDGLAHQLTQLVAGPHPAHVPNPAEGKLGNTCGCKLTAATALPSLWSTYLSTFATQPLAAVLRLFICNFPAAISYMPSRSNRFFFRFSLVLLVFIGALLALYLADQYRLFRSRQRADNEPETTFRSYPGFGISLPVDYEIHGIDVSRYQRRINWKLAAQMKVNDVQLHFAFIKATEGTTLIDPQFERNWRKSREAGMVRGAYHFFRQETDAHQQALHFIRQVKLRKGDLPPVLDVEKFTGVNPDNFIAGIGIWLKTVELHYGKKPIIYTNASFYNNWLASHFSDYPLWVAHYRQRFSPKVEGKWLFWQHNESGRVNGIHSYVDFNVFYGSQQAFNDLLLD